MSSYRRYVAKHGAATARAKRQIRRHGLETSPMKGSVDDSDRIVAYRTTLTAHRNLLRCLDHPLPEGPTTIPMASDDLPDGGLCTFFKCGKDVLMDWRPVPRRNTR